MFGRSILGALRVDIRGNFELEEFETRGRSSLDVAGNQTNGEDSGRPLHIDVIV